MHLFNFPPSKDLNLIRCKFDEETKEFEFYLVDKDGKPRVSMGRAFGLPIDDSEKSREYMAHNILWAALHFYRQGYAAAKRDVRNELTRELT